MRTISLGTEIELISFAQLAWFAQSLRSWSKIGQKLQASQLSSPTAPSGFESCAACPVLIPRSWPLRFCLSRAGLPVWQASACSGVLANRPVRNVFTGENLVYGDNRHPPLRLFHGVNSHKAAKAVHKKWAWTKRERVKDSVVNVAMHHILVDDSVSETR